MSNKVLGDKDVNAAVSDQSTAPEKDVKSLEYHRQALQSKMADEKLIPALQLSSPRPPFARLT